MHALIAFVTRLFNALFQAHEEHRLPLLDVAWLGGLYAAGIALYGKFLNWGRIPFEFEDWAEITGPRLAFLKDAITRGVFPLHISEPSVLRVGTDRFFAVPDVFASPQVILLRWLEPGAFVLVNTLLFFSIGYIALLIIRRRFKLSLFAFTVLFFLFNFNGHILTHLSIGHANWVGYFLFPWLALLTLRLLDENQPPVGLGWMILTGVLLAVMYAQGSFHHFVWSLIFLALVGLFNLQRGRRVWLPVLGGGLAAGLLSLWRMLPTLADAGRFGGEFISGYTTVSHLLWAALLPRSPWEAVDIALPFSTVSWWEFDLFIGVIGAGFLALFGVYRWLKTHNEASANDGLAVSGLLLPLLVLGALSIGRLYRFLMVLPIPLLNGERVSSRIFSLVLVFLIIIAVVQLQRWLDRSNRSPLFLLAGLILLVLQIQDQWLYVKLWQVSNVALNMRAVPLDLAVYTAANHPDPQYTALLIAGAAASAVSLAGMLIALAVLRRKEIRPS